MAIHPTAIIDPTAQIGEDVEIHPYCVIDRETIIGDRCVIGPHVVIRKWTTVGEECVISTGAVLGEPPQDRKYQGEKTFLKLGKGNQIREYVTLHRASGEGKSTIVGDYNMIMAYSHAGHNVQIGNHCQVANCVQIAGHTVIQDYVNIGGLTGFHQFVTVGKMAMVGAMSRNSRDVPPFSIVEGYPAEVRGLNVIGLERREVDPKTRVALRKAFRLLFRSEHNITDALREVAETVEPKEEVLYLCEFVKRVNEGSMGRQLSRR